MSNRDTKEIREVVEGILKDYKKERDIDRMEVFGQPDTEAVRTLIRKLLRVVYPGYFRDTTYKIYNVDSTITVLIEDIIYNLSKQIALVLPEDEKQDTEEKAHEIAVEFCRRIPMIREFLDTDLDATLEGDPAALNKDEIILSYPGIMATTIYRLAHELFLLEVPLIPRMMTEYAHSITGIDINPGATIGKYFFMDHGTGIVIGSTTIIGEHVKVYQGVTLGALSTSGGQSLRGSKRHPTIEDNVTIYAGASILGGNTVIGEGSVIGSNAFITKAIPAGTRVTISQKEN